MRHAMLCRLLAAVFIFGTALTAAQPLAQATEETLYYDEILVQVMPQYVEPEGWTEGQPLVLVGQHGVLRNPSEEAVSPLIEVHVPSDKPDFILSLVGDFGEDDTVYEVAHEFDEQTGAVSWVPDKEIPPGESYQFVIEYYMDPFDIDGDAHAFTFDYTIDYDASEISVMIFEPYGASDFTIGKEEDRTTEMFNIPVYGFDRADVSAGWSDSFDVSYVKSDPVTTLEALETMEPPDDDIHAGFRNDLNEFPEDHPDVAGMEGGGSPVLIDTTSAIIISAAIIIAAVLVFFGLRSRPAGSKRSTTDAQAAPVDLNKERQRLRKKYMNGEITDEVYKQEMRKLAGK
ncbi:hypothetical protein [Salisediminibacterium selenitireducens]|uniref:SHOCT domain-containing protein n=1 Tax=Bacillus selenitireducens (strain ATCC 700615 / DSM 15326 / MLS10) TaxID=439292 RepID=D6XSN3_BACIE|nr:hypothetical protein [Salisediminibacterium selenitireducens]ADH98819.1 hypothetical protein Bsel_1307 [[Bacillus] selenitireducens MLS10]